MPRSALLPVIHLSPRLQHIITRAEARSVSWIRDWRTALVVGLLILHGILVWVSRSAGVETGNDEAWYLLLARSVRALEYTDRHLLGNPPHSQYPPGFPTLLALSTMAFGERFDALLAVVALCSVISLAFVYDTVRRFNSSEVALTVLAMCAVNPLLIEFGGKLMSETPYLLLASVTIWALSRDRPTDETRRQVDRLSGPSGVWPAVAIAGAVAAALTRTFGITLIAALALTWTIERRYRRVAALIGTAGLTVGTWMLWTIMAPSRIAGRSYIADAALIGGGPESPLAAIASRVWTNVSHYVTRSIPSAIPQPTVEGTPTDNFIGLLLFAAFTAVGAWVLSKQARIVVIYLATCAALLAIWPWTIDRFLVAILPLLLWAMMAGVFVLSRRRWLRPLPLLVAAGVIATAIARDATWIRAASRCDREAARTSPECFTATQLGFFAAAAFAERETPDTSAFLTIGEATFGFVAQRRVLQHARLGAANPADLLPALRRQGVTYVLLSPVQPAYLQGVDWFLQNCNQLAPVARFAGSNLLLQVTAPQNAEARSACDELKAYILVERDERNEKLTHPRIR